MIAALLAAALFLALAMALAWGVQRVTGNSGWIDMTWSFATGIAALLALALLPAEFSRRALLALLVMFWSARLGLHIWSRTRHSTDDPRYAKLMEGWGKAAPARLFLFLQIQALAGLVLVAAVLLAASGMGLVLSPTTMVLAAFAILAVVGEALADAQLASWKRKGIKGGICEDGLWSLSRHPNYLFEWLFWCAIALLAVTPPGSPWSWLALLAPAMMYALLRHGSGVPHLEEHMKRTRPEAFADYAARVPVFFPRLWPRK